MCKRCQKVQRARCRFRPISDWNFGSSHPITVHYKRITNSLVMSWPRWLRLFYRFAVYFHRSEEARLCRAEKSRQRFAIIPSVDHPYTYSLTAGQFSLDPEHHIDTQDDNPQRSIPRDHLGHVVRHGRHVVGCVPLTHERHSTDIQTLRQPCWPHGTFTQKNTTWTSPKFSRVSKTFMSYFWDRANGSFARYKNNRQHAQLVWHNRPKALRRSNRAV